MIIGIVVDLACDETSNRVSNGNDGWALVKGVETDFEVLDVIGQNIFDPTYSDPGSSWSVAGVTGATKNHTLVRKPTTDNGTTMNPSPFDPTISWDSLPANTFANVGWHNCTCDPNYSGNPDNVYGCMNDSAINYNAIATIDDNSCEFNSCNTFIEEYKNTFYLYHSSEGKIHISNDLSINSVSVYNEIGKLVLSQEITNMQKTEINIGDRKGLFIVSIKDTYGLKTKSILVR